MSFLNHQISLLYQPVGYLLLSLHHLINRQERTEDHNVKRRVLLRRMNAELGRRLVILAQLPSIAFSSPT